MPTEPTPQDMPPERRLNLTVPGQTDINKEGNIVQSRQSIDISQPNFDIKDQNQDPNADRAKKEAELEALRKYIGRVESPGELKLYSAKNAYEVFVALRETVLPPMEDAHRPRSMDMSYKPPSQRDVIAFRARDLSISIEELEKRGYIKKGTYNEETGVAEVTDEANGGYAMYTTYTQRINRELGSIESVPTYHFGTKAERESLAEAYKVAGLELEARAIIGETVGVFMNLDARDNLERVVEWMHGQAPKFKAEHLKALFNAPDLEELRLAQERYNSQRENKDRKPEKLNNELGKKIEYSMFLYAVMLHSGTKQEMKSFLRRPGSAEIIRQIIRKSGEKITQEDWIKKNIGDVDKWMDNPTEETDFEEDVKNGVRGPVTVFGNIVAFKTSSGKVFSRDMERNYIEKTIGSIAGSVEASWVGVTFLKAIDTFSSQGHTILSDGSVVATLGEGRYMEPIDTQKFASFVWNFREGKKARTFGVHDQLGKTPDMLFDLFDWAQVAVQAETGEIIYRSIWDAWLGTEEQDKLFIGTMSRNVIENVVSINDLGNGWVRIKCEDPKTGKIETRKGVKKLGEDPDKDYEITRKVYGDVVRSGGKVSVNERVPEEPYHELGSLDYGSLISDFHGVHNTIKWLNGREGAGVLSDAMSYTFDPSKIDQKLFLAQWKYITIGLNPVVQAKGSMHKFSFGGNGDESSVHNVTLDLSEYGVGQITIRSVDGKAYEDIQHTFQNNIWLSRLKSEFFVTKVALGGLDIPDIDGTLSYKSVKVPFHRIIRAEMELMNGSIPKTIEGLRKWRVNYQKLAIDTKNYYNDNIAYFEKQVRYPNGVEKPVGPITGVNKNFK